MPRVLQYMLAVLLGLVVGCAVNMALVTIGPRVIPLPEGVDLSDMDKLAENLPLLKPVNFLAPWLAHALGTFVAAAIAARLSPGHSMQLALGISVLFMMGGIAMVVKIGGPGWFSVLDLVGAYLPMGYLGGMVSTRSLRSA